jgi:small GTP-binding protein
VFEAHFHGGFGVSQALRQFMSQNGWLELSNEPSTFINAKSPLALRMLAGESSLPKMNDAWRNRLLKPPRIALLGPPNAGKSTLFNAWLNEKRVTVTSHKGTTRDFVEEPVFLGVGDNALAATLIDSAGIWDVSADGNDAAAVKMSLELIAEVDECIWILDSAAAINDSLHQLINSRLKHGDIVCLNRCDLDVGLNQADSLTSKVLRLDMPSHQQRCTAIEEALFKKWGVLTSEQLS